MHYLKLWRNICLVVWICVFEIHRANSAVHSVQEFARGQRKFYFLKFSKIADKSWIIQGITVVQWVVSIAVSQLQGPLSSGYCLCVDLCMFLSMCQHGFPLVRWFPPTSQKHTGMWIVYAELLHMCEWVCMWIICLHSPAQRKLWAGEWVPWCHVMDWHSIQGIFPPHTGCVLGYIPDPLWCLQG